MIADAKPIMAIRPTNSSFFLVNPKPCKMFPFMLSVMRTKATIKQDKILVSCMQA